MGRRVTVVALVGIALVALPALAFAAAGPAKGAKYSGFATPSSSGITISWKVSSNGKKVASIKLSNVPIFCSAGGGPVSATFKTASIKKSKFTSTAAADIQSGPNQGQPQYRLKLKGRFTKTKSATGTITVDWFGADKSCDGESTFFAQPR